MSERIRAGESLPSSMTWGGSLTATLIQTQTESPENGVREQTETASAVPVLADVPSRLARSRCSVYTTQTSAAGRTGNAWRASMCTMENASDTVAKTSQRKLAIAKSSLIGSLARHLRRIIIGIPNTKSNKAIIDMVVEIASRSMDMNVIMEKLWASIITFLGDGRGRSVRMVCRVGRID